MRIARIHRNGSAECCRRSVSGQPQPVYLLDCWKFGKAWKESVLVPANHSRSSIRSSVFCLTLSVLLPLLAPCPARSQSEALDAKYAQAVKAFQAKDLDVAEREFISIQRAAPTAPEPYFFLGKIYLVRDQLRKAQAALQKAIQLKPDFADAMESLGVVYLREKNYKDAQSILSHAIRLDSQNAFAQLDLGTAYMNQGRFPEAARQFHAALRLAQNNRGVATAANYNLGQLFEALSHDLAKRGAYDEAISDFRQYERMFPRNPLVHLSLGIAYYNQTSFDPALAEFKEAVRLDPNSPRAYYSAAQACAMLRRWDDAQRYLTASLDLNRKSYEANYLMGSVLISSLDYVKAVPYLRAAIALDPGKAGAYRKLGEAYLSEAKANQALAPLKQAVALNPADSQAHWLLARAYRELNQTALARKEIEAFRNAQSIERQKRKGAGAAAHRR